MLILTASMGAGHVVAGAELARRLAARGAAVSTLDLIADVPGAGARLRATYRFLLAHAPWLYDAAMRFWSRHPAPLERVTAVGDRPFAAAIARAVTTCAPDVVVSTFNLGSQCLRRMRVRGRLAVPVVTVVTDPGAHPYWLGSPDDLHVAYLARTVGDLRDLGARAEVVRPLVRPRFDEPPGRDAARSAVGVAGRVVVVSAGSWAAGEVRATVDALGGDPGTTVVVLCGHDDRLRRSLSGRAGVLPLGWVEEVEIWLAAADVVVDNAGGLTCWEALTVGSPVVLYRPLPGHGRLNARVLAQEGLAAPAAGPQGLRAAVRAARVAPFVPTGPDAADVVLARAASRA